MEKKTLIIYLDAEGKSRMVITPHNQGPEYNDEERFDGNWVALVHQHTKGNYYSFKVV